MAGGGRGSVLGLRRPWLAVVTPFLVFSSGLRGKTAMAPGDGYVQYIPWYTLSAESWQRLMLPSWNPFPYAGTPLLAAGQAAVFYPPNLLFAVLPAANANSATIVTTFLVAGLGAYFLARHLFADDLAATVGGLVFGLCGFLFAHIGHQSMIATVAWLPWVILGLDRMRERPSILRLLTGAIPISLCLFAGHLQMFTFVCATAAAYIVVFALLDVRTSHGRPLLTGAAVFVTGFALAAVQLVPTAMYVGLTQRSAVDYEMVVTYAMPRSHLVLGFFPFLFGGNGGSGYAGLWNFTEMTWYAGVGSLVFAATGIHLVRRDRRLTALTVVAVGMFVIALGEATPLSRLVHSLPIYGQYRAWARYLVAVNLVTALVAAGGVKTLRTAGADRRRALLPALAATMIVLLAGAAATRVGSVDRYVAEVPAALALAPIAAAVIALATVALWGRRPRLGVGLAVALVLVEPIAVFGWHTEWRNVGPTPSQLEQARHSGEAFWGHVTDRPGGLDRFLFVGGDITPAGSDMPGITDYKGIRSANGNDPLTPKAYAEAAAAMTAFGGTGDPEKAWAPESRLLDLLRVTTVLLDTWSSAGGPPPGSLLENGVPVAPAQPRDPQRLIRYEHQPAVPEAFLVGATRRSDRKGALRALAGIEPFDVAGTVVVEGDDCPDCPAGPPGPAGRVVDVRWGQNSVAVDVVADRQAALIVSQSHIEGWSARIDGKRAPVFRADGVVQGVAVPPGTHTIVLRYVPPGLRLGATISALTLAALLGGAVLVRRRRASLPVSTPAPQEEP